MKTKTKILLVVLLLCIPMRIFGQQESQFTQYMYNTLTINPAYAGSREGLSVLGVYRSQWVGINGAPETQNIALHSPIGNGNIGLGFTFFNDNVGPSSEQNINADASYTITVSRNTQLAFGIKGGVNMLNVNLDELTFDPNDPNAQNVNNNISPNIGAGVFMYNPSWYVGLSSPNILRTSHYSEFEASRITEEMHLYLIGGYIFDINENFKLKPAVLAKAVTGAPLAIDISANALFLDTFTLGAAYRWDATVSAMAAFQLSNALMIGYAYDYDTTTITDASSGSHEVFLRFELSRTLEKYVNPRFF